MQISIGHCLVNGFHCGGGRTVGWRWLRSDRGGVRWSVGSLRRGEDCGRRGGANPSDLSRINLSASRQIGICRRRRAQDVKRNYTGRQIYCGQPVERGEWWWIGGWVGRGTCWRMSRRRWRRRRRVCSHSRPGYTTVP